ncbi:MAG: inositol monophosphatase family protein [Rikenellaceae bacterium]
MIQFNDFKYFVYSLRDEIVAITQKYYYSDLDIEHKHDMSPVTLADREIEQYIRAKIEVYFPNHTIIGEEFGEKKKEGDLSSWIIDPIDGTYSFIHRIPLFTTLIAYCYDSKPVFGMIFQPITGEIVIGSDTKTLYNDKPAILRTSESLEGCTLLTTSTTNIDRLHNGDKFRELSLEAKVVRTWADGYGYLMLVSGRADVMIDPKMKIWDIAAVTPIVKGAGGVITDYYGEVAEAGNSIIASTNEKLHSYVINELKE